MTLNKAKKDNFINCIDSKKIIGGYSTRNGGYSTGDFAGQNLGLNTNDDQDTLEKNRTTFFSTVATGFAVASAQQTHSANIKEASANTLTFPDTDGLYTTESGILLTITVADCGCVLLYNEHKPFVAALHCGWRGTHAGIISKMGCILKQHDDISNFKAIIGPMIQCKSYEVGAEFSNYFPSEYLIPKKDKYLFDLNKRIEDELIQIGISSVNNLKIDTFTNSDLFYSYRKSSNTGRFCGYIGIW